MSSMSLQRALAVLALVLGPGLAAQAPQPSDPAARKPRAVAPKAPKPTRKQRMKHVPDSQLVDLNTASKDQLMKLKGVDAACADRIIRGRHYFTKSRLVLEGVMDMTVYLANKDRIYVSQDLKKYPPPAPKSPAKPRK